MTTNVSPEIVDVGISCTKKDSSVKALTEIVGAHNQRMVEMELIMSMIMMLVKGPLMTKMVSGQVDLATKFTRSAEAKAHEDEVGDVAGQLGILGGVSKAAGEYHELLARQLSDFIKP